MQQWAYIRQTIAWAAASVCCWVYDDNLIEQAALQTGLEKHNCPTCMHRRVKSLCCNLSTEAVTTI